MLNKILQQLNGHGGEAASLEAALVQLGRDRDETRTQIEELNKRRHRMLLDDASDAELDKIERQIDRATTRLEKLNLSEPPLLEKLSGARSAARQRRWNSHHENYLAAVTDFLTAARAAEKSHTALIAIVEAARRAGFEAEASAMMPATPNISGHLLCAPDLLDRFELAITPRSTPAVSRVSPVVAVTVPHVRPRMTDSQKPATLAPPPSQRDPVKTTDDCNRRVVNAPPMPEAPDFTLEPGEARVVIIRSGFQDTTGKKYRAGQHATLPCDMAESAALNGAVEILLATPPAPANVTVPTADL